MLFGATPLVVTLVVWGVVTTVFIGLMIYRSVIGMHEEDQLFLSSSVLASQQKDIVAKLDRLEPYTKAFGWGSLALLLVAAGLWVYQALNHFQGSP